MPKEVFVGIDVSQERLDVHVLPEGTSFTCNTDTKSIDRLVKQLRKLVPFVIVMEATGGLTAQQIGWLFSVFGIFSMAANIPGGWLADKKGERVAIALGFALNFVAMVIFLQTGSFWGFAASWGLFGVGVGLLNPAYQSFTSKVVPEHLRGTAFGLVRGGLGAFSLPAPAIGGQLWKYVSPRFPFQLTAWATLLSAIPVWLKFRLPEGKETHEEAQTGT